MPHYFTARDPGSDPAALLAQKFSGQVTGACDAVFTDAGQRAAWGISGLERRAPVMEALVQTEAWAVGVSTLPAGSSLLLVWSSAEGTVKAFTDKAGAFVLTPALADQAAGLCRASEAWGGGLEHGVHIFDPRDPFPGPHFGSNLLLGDRRGFPSPLQTTPKSVVDAWGRGSFRSHAATQVLATRWDYRQEENGFPANRQFYLTEEGRQVFYSADPGVADVRCEHSPNLTVIRHRTADGLEVVRRIFLLPQEPGLPLACEVQEIRVTNTGSRPRNLRLVTAGMFGASKPGALMEDVLYSTIIMQAGVLKTPEGEVLALSPDYCPLQDRQDLRFHSLRLRTAEGLVLPREFGTNLTKFLAGGTLEQPRGLAVLGNVLDRKGPGFFALGVPFVLAPGGEVTAESFTGLVSGRGAEPLVSTSLGDQIQNLLGRFAPGGSLEAVVQARAADFRRFAGYLQVSSGNPRFDDTVNANLPFQILYQSFASRSFCQTQKGYREIGFREIQDLFASMLYFQACGQSALVADLLGQWAAQVHEYGFANHNFYWEGKEPGLWSDDALWLVQAVHRYVGLTGDPKILSTVLPMAGGGERTLLDTLKAVVRYSGEVSVGPHGLPLLDRADWNDCLKVDTKTWDGPEKQRRVAAGESLSGYTESVMNAFLLVTAAGQLADLAAQAGDPETARWSRGVGASMAAACQEHAWKGNWFCRLLVNRPTAYPVVGAAGDGLASDGSEGSYFINSFSWAILSGTARPEQVGPMFQVLESRLKTDHGYRLVSSVDLRRVEPTVAAAEYFAGDRENGAVFKHASMMAAAALFEAAATHPDPALARRMAAAGWWMVDLVLPGRCLEDPYRLGGNPRFCTQYNNSETGQNIGPLLSGTAPWLALALNRAWGLVISGGTLVLDPLLRERDTSLTLNLNTGGGAWTVTYRKPQGFYRNADQPPTIILDGRTHRGGPIPLAREGGGQIEVLW